MGRVAISRRAVELLQRIVLTRSVRVDRINRKLEKVDSEVQEGRVERTELDVLVKEHDVRIAALERKVADLEGGRGG